MRRGIPNKLSNDILQPPEEFRYVYGKIKHVDPNLHWTDKHEYEGWAENENKKIIGFLPQFEYENFKYWKGRCEFLVKDGQSPRILLAETVEKVEK
jgi:hypothetical protein